jgi:aminoglycoside phosphotransferase (APT) family kinase protein
MGAVEQYAAAAGVDPGTAGLVLDLRGKQHVVLVDRAAGLVWRFPRTPARLALLPDDAARLRAARRLGLPAPAVLGSVLDAPLGRAHLLLEYLPGVAMDDPVVRGIDDAAAARLGRDLAALLHRIRCLPAGAWPLPAPEWVGLWEALATRLSASVLPLLPTALAERAAEDLDRAITAARQAPRGLIHGDLGGVNVRVDPATGALTGVLDWDGAVPGDPAVDTIAVAVGADPRVVAAMLAAGPELAGDLDRARAYVATWALQEMAWGLGHDDPGLTADGLARFTAG